jgi:hypothetical protein
MKLTESALRDIIKQEITKAINENEAEPQLTKEIQAVFQKLGSLDASIRADKEYGIEYPKLVQQFVQYYRSGGNTKLVIQSENNEVVPLAAVVAYQAVFGKR